MPATAVTVNCVISNGSRVSSDWLTCPDLNQTAWCFCESVSRPNLVFGWCACFDHESSDLVTSCVSCKRVQALRLKAADCSLTTNSLGHHQFIFSDELVPSLLPQERMRCTFNSVLDYEMALIVLCEKSIGSHCLLACSCATTGKLIFPWFYFAVFLELLHHITYFDFATRTLFVSN